MSCLEEAWSRPQALLKTLTLNRIVQDTTRCTSQQAKRSLCSGSNPWRPEPLAWLGHDQRKIAKTIECRRCLVSYSCGGPFKVSVLGLIKCSGCLVRRAPTGPGSGALPGLRWSPASRPHCRCCIAAPWGGLNFQPCSTHGSTQAILEGNGSSLRTPGETRTSQSNRSTTTAPLPIWKECRLLELQRGICNTTF